MYRSSVTQLGYFGASVPYYSPYGGIFRKFGPSEIIFSSCSTITKRMNSFRCAILELPKSGIMGLPYPLCTLQGIFQNVVSPKVFSHHVLTTTKGMNSIRCAVLELPERGISGFWYPLITLLGYFQKFGPSEIIFSSCFIYHKKNELNPMCPSWVTKRDIFGLWYPPIHPTRVFSKIWSLTNYFLIMFYSLQKEWTQSDVPFLSYPKRVFWGFGTP
jgi:hypothetical protein